MKKIVIHPITRIEGHLKVEVTVDNGKVADANIAGTLFRGIELILRGRDPRDAVIISQRICGVCPEPHAIASVWALEDCMNLEDKIPENGILLRNIIQGTRTVADHILHFYILSGLDYVDPLKVLDYEGKDINLNALKSFLQNGYTAPFLPRDEMDYRLDKKTTIEVASHYLKALDIYKKAQEAATIFGGKWPHDCAIVGGGVSEKVTSDKISSFLWRLEVIEDFVKNYYIPDVIAIAITYNDYLEIGKGCQKLLAYGGYRIKSNGLYNDLLIGRGTVKNIDRLDTLDVESIAEDIEHSYYENAKAQTQPLNPKEGVTSPKALKEQAYSWIKSPRYKGETYEVGPLAGVLVTYLGKDNNLVKELVDSSLSQIGGNISNLYSVMGRHLTRAIMATILCEYLKIWAKELKPGEPAASSYTPVPEGEGIGLTEAPRGALGHWLKVENERISNYQVITPTAWNASPKDRNKNPGPIEQALIGTSIKESPSPIEVLRIIRSFDPCTACAVHLLSTKGNLIGKYKVV
ncbi:MAG: nickel-dependent hydrogenase large subunit [Actinobacteria bacterium]|nr:nickel-dependent hydrogenase large subunit [Actinomycetota bacterium]